MNTTTQQETRQTYNGWTNYATWRIALEWFDDYKPNRWETDVYTLSKECQNYVESTLDDMTTQSQLLKDYAFAFLDDVNWYEIAEHLIDENN